MITINPTLDVSARRPAAKALAWLVCATALLLAIAAPVSAAPDLRVVADVPDTVTAGEPIILRIWVRNVGDTSATGTIVVDQTASAGLQLPTELDGALDVTFDGMLVGDPIYSCGSVGQTFSCSSEMLFPPGRSASFNARTAVVAPDAEGTIDYQVTLSGDLLGDPITIEREMTVGGTPPFGFAPPLVRLLDTDGQPQTQAGSTPRELETRMRLNTRTTQILGAPVTSSSAHPKDISVDLPAGLIADPTVVGHCTSAQLTTFNPQTGATSCPQESQIGLLLATLTEFRNNQIVPLYNMEPPPGAPAALGANVLGVPVVLVAQLRDGDYGVRVVSRNTSSTLPLTQVETMVWGAPSQARHDGMRGLCMPPLSGAQAPGNCPTSRTGLAFMRLPTSCDGNPLGFTLLANSYESPGSFVSEPFSAAATEGCDQVPFDPELSVTPTSDRAGAPTGLDAVLSMPQTSNPDGLAQADLRQARVVLPEGMSINPASAHGLAACSDAQLRIGQPGAASCPDASKIGTVSVETPLLDHVLEGSVFVRSQSSGDPGSGEMFRIALEVRSDEDGVHMKLPGAVAADPATGRLTTTFDNTPQLPFSEFRLHFKGGPRAPLVNPPGCGEHQVGIRLEGWNGAVRTPPVSFDLDQDCAPAGFDPAFEAGSVNPVAGVFSPFVARIVRPDGDRELGRINMTLPKGLVADLSKVDTCSEARVAAAVGRSGVVAQGQPVCPAGSQIGTTTVGAGVGPDPYFPLLPGSKASGRVFLTDAYAKTAYQLADAGAPDYGLAIEVPAVAGPYDLGDVIVKASVYVDPETAQISVVSEALPRVVKGIRLFVQDVRVNVDRPDYTVTPTSCAPASVLGDIRDPADRSALRATRYQVGDCARLRLTPKLRLRVSGRRQMRTGGHPALHARLTQPSGQANIARAKVTLPKSLVLDPTNANNAGLLCSYEQGLAADCPASSIIGYARAVSPLLKRPLAGPVYFVQGKRRDPRTGNLIRTLPSILATLEGEIAVTLRGKTSATAKGLTTTFPVIPDAAVSSFAIDLKGGKRKGILTVTKTAQGANQTLCRKPQTATTAYTGHNNRRASTRTRLKTPCAKAGKSKRARAKRR
jgi:hypothetical protein